MSEERSPLDAALDLMVFAPVGLVITAAEQLPGFARKGRARVESQVTAARMVGRLAVAQGSRELSRRRAGRADHLHSEDAPSDARDGTSRPPRAGDQPTSGLLGAGIEGGAGHLAPSGKEAGSKAVDRSGTVSPPKPQGRRYGSTQLSGTTLAIPGYDSLSASQVVSRLAGLTAPELEDVGAYEAANRGRRTVMTRIRQLQG